MPGTDWVGLIRSGDCESLAAKASEALGVELYPEAFMEHCRTMLHPRMNATGWSDCTWRMWLKRRAELMGAYRAGEDPGSVEHVTAILHTGFLCILETPDELARLRNEHIKPANPKPARSRLGKALIAINPIDSVAHKVAPPLVEGER